MCFTIREAQKNDYFAYNFSIWCYMPGLLWSWYRRIFLKLKTEARPVCVVILQHRAIAQKQIKSQLVMVGFQFAITLIAVLLSITRS